MMPYIHFLQTNKMMETVRTLDERNGYMYEER